MTITLHTRALLVSLNIGMWEARRYDKQVSQEIADQHHTSNDAGRYNKNLLLKSDNSHKALNSHLASVRMEHYKQTLPWSDEGWRLLPISNYMQYTAMLRKSRKEFEGKLETFLADYPTLQAAAKAARNGLLKDEEYPSVSKLRKRYYLEADYKPVPRGDDFRISLADEEIAELASNCESKVRDAFASAQLDAVNRLFDCLKRMNEKLSQPDAIYRDTLITNARELCDVLSRLNIGEDQNLESIREQLERIAINHEPQELREDKDTRAQVAKETAQLMSAMQGLYGTNLGGSYASE